MAGIIIGVIVLAIVIGISLYKKNKLKEEGAIIDRKGDFYRQKEIFTLKPFDFVKFIDTLHTLDWKRASNWGYSESKKLIIFDMGVWKAQLCLVEETGNHVTYEFKFTSWEERNGNNIYALQMNATLTNVEKAFLMTDPETTVRSEYVKYK